MTRPCEATVTRLGGLRLHRAKCRIASNELRGPSVRLVLNVMDVNPKVDITTGLFLAWLDRVQQGVNHLPREFGQWTRCSVSTGTSSHPLTPVVIDSFAGVELLGQFACAAPGFLRS